MKQLQSSVKQFCRQYGMEMKPEHALLDTLSELGEVAKEILKVSNYGKQPIAYSDAIKAELGDVLYSLITVANAFEINLEKALTEAMDKYKKRLLHGSADSKHEKNI